jgi:hypothetical protein
MEQVDYSEMTNSELKELTLKLENEFEAQKAKIKKECERLGEIENEYFKVQREISTRKVIF